MLRERGNSAVIPMRWKHNALYLLDQRILPHDEVWLEYRSPAEVATAITDMVVRGAPAIGITAALGMVLSAFSHRDLPMRHFQKKWREDATEILRARPTAVNLLWAVNRMKAVFSENPGCTDTGELVSLLEKRAFSIWTSDIEANLLIGKHGGKMMPDRGGVLTHCNAGALATGGYGTALGVIRSAVFNGKRIKVYADETRPWFQGARLTAWELLKDGINVTLAVDSASGFLMSRGLVQAAIVGSDRIAANGDVANKIGTYNLALAARAHDIPFYVAAPISTIDPDTASGKEIPVEERQGEEITCVAGTSIAPAGVEVTNPVFDVTPYDLVTAIITEKGIVSPPFTSEIHK